jgi:hypothetical protein
MGGGTEATARPVRRRHPGVGDGAKAAMAAVGGRRRLGERDSFPASIRPRACVSGPNGWE